MKPGDYIVVNRHLSGFVLDGGDEPTIVTCGVVVVPWDNASKAARHGWRIVGVPLGFMKLIIMRKGS